jgi:hypothetical protein
MILRVRVQKARSQDQEGGTHLLKPLGGRVPRLTLIWADSASKKGGFLEWATEIFGWGVEVVEHPLEQPVRRVSTQGHCSRWGQDSPQWLPRAHMALDGGATLRLALHLAQTCQG